MTDFDAVDFFTDKAIIADPYPYFEHLRSRGPITRLPSRNVMAITGYDEAAEVYRDDETFSDAIRMSLCETI